MTPEPEIKPVPSAAPEAPYPKPVRAWYVLGLLTFAYFFSFLDRTILSLLVGPIRHDLHISDTQVSLLIGLSFAVFYTFLGIPIGRLSDSQSRRKVIAAGITVWSLFCAGCGLAKSFGEMLVLRVGVGVGEASLSPSAYSLLTDYFVPERRGLAQSIYGTGIYIGTGAASILGGLVTGWASGRAAWSLPLLGDVRSWQIVFLVVGLPGLLLATMMFTFAEPVRRGRKYSTSVPLRDVFAYIKSHRKTYLCSNLGIAFMALAAYGGVAWNATFFIRHHHLTVAQAGRGIGIAIAVGGTLGMLFGGWLADRLVAHGYEDAFLRVSAMAMAAAVPVAAAYLLVSDARLAMILMTPAVGLTAIPIGLAPAALMQVTPCEMRGQVSAVYLFVINIIGLGAGPTVVALVTDHIFHNDAMVGSSLLLVGVISNILSVAFLWGSLKSYVRSQRQLQEWVPA